MTLYKKLAFVAFAMLAVSLSAASAGLASEAGRHVVANQEIQAKIDQQLGQANADRQAIQGLLQRADVRQIAGAAGLDIERASVAAGILSGPALEQLAAQARAADADLTGGSDRIVISATTLIIILLIIIIVAN